MSDSRFSTYNNIWKEDVVKNLNYTKVLCKTYPCVKKKDIGNAEAFQQLNDIAELSAGLICGKCKGACDKLNTKFKNGQPIQLCPCCETRKNQKPTHERKFH